MKTVFCLWQLTTDEFENPLEYLEGIFENHKKAMSELRKCRKYAKNEQQDYQYKVTMRELE